MDEPNKQEVFTGNKNWKPPMNKSHQSIKALEEILDEDINRLVTKNKIRNNISTKDKEALFVLRNNKDIVIKKSDKGGGIVVMDTDDYVKKIETMLSDSDTYSQNITVNIEKAKIEIDTIIINLHCKNYISNRQKRFLTNFTPKMPVFYGLPKIHKKDTPLRPIVSQIDSPSYKLNKYLDYLLTTAEKRNTIPFTGHNKISSIS
jgi:hypothetical protein